MAMRTVVALLVLATLAGCSRTVDKTLEYERVCWGDGVCHLVEKNTGAKYYPADHPECR